VTPALSIRRAVFTDVPVILRFIHLIADSEERPDLFVANENSLREELFGSHTGVEVLLGFEGAKPVAFAAYFHTFSTYLARRGIWLEDLFVLPEARGRGYGKKLLQAIARIALDRRCGRFEWTVHTSNHSSIDFFSSLGVVPMDDRTLFRAAGASLEQLAGLARSG
jgi:GNAT superfamily N-acetyltransferase